MILNVRENDVNNSLLFLRLNITKLTLQPVPRDFRVFHSLIPRPSLAPVFDCLQYFMHTASIKNWSRGRPGNKARESNI